MIPQHQTNEKGCWEACIASILEIPLDCVPSFFVNQRNGYEKTNEWLGKKYGLGLLSCRVEYVNCEFARMRHPSKCVTYEILNKLPVYHIISGKYSNKKGHSVVGFSGKEIFDPNSMSRRMRWISFDYFVGLNPRRGEYLPDNFILCNRFIVEAENEYSDFRKST